jgi:ParB-like chromosome segregation protein Spo0J
LMKQEVLKQIPVSSIDFAGKNIIARFFSEQPESEEIAELVQSVKKHGVLEPVIVRPKGSNRYEIVAGNRRLRAAKIVRLDTIPTIVRDVDNMHARIIAFVENMFRKDYEGIEKAKGIAAIYQDVGIPKEIAIKKVHRMMNKGESLRETFSKDHSYKPDADPTPEFLEAFNQIPLGPNRQYVLLQLVTQLSEPAQSAAQSTEKETGKKIPTKKLQLLTHSRLKKYPEVQEYLLELIKPKKVSLNKAKQIVDQAIRDLESGQMWVEKGVVCFGSGRKKEDDITKEPEKEKITFDVNMPDFTQEILHTIGKLLDRPITRGEIDYAPKVYQPKLEEFKKNLYTVRKEYRKQLAIHAYVLMQICKVIVDSAK